MRTQVQKLQCPGLQSRTGAVSGVASVLALSQFSIARCGYAARRSPSWVFACSAAAAVMAMPPSACAVPGGRTLISGSTPSSKRGVVSETVFHCVCGSSQHRFSPEMCSGVAWRLLLKIPSITPAHETIASAACIRMPESAGAHGVPRPSLVAVRSCGFIRLSVEHATTLAGATERLAQVPSQGAPVPSQRAPVPAPGGARPSAEPSPDSAESLAPPPSLRAASAGIITTEGLESVTWVPLFSIVVFIAPRARRSEDAPQPGRGSATLLGTASSPIGGRPRR